MYEMLFSVSLYLIDSILSGVYTWGFLKGKYRKKAVLTAWGAVCFIVQTAVFELLCGNASLDKLEGIILNIGILLLMQSVFYKKDIPKQFFAVFSFLAGREIVRNIVMVLSILFGDFSQPVLDYFLAGGVINTLEKSQFFETVYATVFTISCLSFYTLLLSVYLHLINKMFVKKNYFLQTQETIFLILPCAAVLCISIILKLIMISVENGMTIFVYDTIPATKFWIPVICFLLLSTIIANVVLFQKLVQYSEETGKCAMLENQARHLQKEIAEIQDIYTDMRGLRHDMRSHLAGIAALVRNSAGLENKELESYIGKMEETVSRLDFSCQTGNPITDIIIHQKGQEAKKKQIQFWVDFACPPKLSIDVYDIAVILNNALENAIEACSRAEGERQIKLRSYVKGSLFFIEVENDFQRDIMMDKETGLPISSKEDGTQHGIRMSNIQRCAKKYRGDIDIVISDTDGRKKFSLMVMMNGKMERHGISHPK